MLIFISPAKSRTASGSSVTPCVKRISLLPRAERTSSLPHQPSPIIATFSIHKLRLQTLRSKPVSPAACKQEHGDNAYDIAKITSRKLSVSETRRRTGLLHRMRAREGVNRQTRLGDAFHGGKRRRVDLEEASAGRLRDNANVS